MSVEFLSVDRYGAVSRGVLSERLSSDVALVSVMYANNETGAINPVRELCEESHRSGALFHTDAVQAPAVLEPDTESSGVDYMSVSSHKIYGPKGVGALYVRGVAQEDGRDSPRVHEACFP